MPGFITSADAVIMLSQAVLFPAPVQLQGFAADDVYNIDKIKSVETIMGVDGVLSAGFIFAEVMQTITLQADSESNDFFDVVWAQMQATGTPYDLNGLVVLPGISTKMVMTRGFLTGYPPSPSVKKVLQPRSFDITWQRIQPQPT